MPAAGLDITDHRVRFLEFVRGNKGLVVQRYGEMKIPTGVIVAGRIKRVDELKKILTSFARKYRLEFVRASLPEERAYLVKMHIPNVADEEIRDTIAFQLEEYVPVPAGEAVFDYTVVGDSKEHEGQVEVAVSVLPHKEVAEYVGMFEGTGIKPMSFEIEAQAVARAVIPTGDLGTYMLLDFGGTRTGIFIVSGGVVRFTSTIDVGSDMITRALEKQFSISTEEAERIKNENGVTRRAADQEFFQAVMSSVSILRDEVNKLFVYWHTHREDEDSKKENKIEKIYISGGGANLKGLSEYLSASLRTKVSVANPWVNVNSFEEYIPSILHRHALGYASVIGLALTSDIECSDYCL